MKCHAALLVAAAAIWSTGCQSPDPLPWKLVELGTEPITSAWERGEAVAAEIEGDRWPGFIFAHDLLHFCESLVNLLLVKSIHSNFLF